MSACSAGPGTDAKVDHGSRQLVAEFEATFDPATGKATIRPLSSGKRDLSEMTVSNGTWGSGPDGTVELNTLSSDDGLAGCDRVNAYCADIAVRSRFQTMELRGVVVELTQTSGAVLAFGDASVPPYGAPGMTDAFGLWTYGTLGFDDTSTRTWKFNMAAQTAFTVSGRVWAEAVPNASPGEGDCTDSADGADGDGAVDCDDPDCALDNTCNAEFCGNGHDDDGDSDEDCADSDCSGNAAYCGSGGGGGACADYSEDFEGAAPGWASGLIAFTVNSWTLSTTSGDGTALGSRMVGNPNNGSTFGREHSAMVSPVLDLTGGATIAFDTVIQNEGGTYDREHLEVSYDGGANWQMLIDQDSADFPEDATLHNVTRPIPMGTATTQFRFRFDTWDGCCGSTFGWWIDNFTVTCP